MYYNFVFYFRDMVSLGARYSQMKREISSSFSEGEQIIVLFNHFLCGDKSGDLVEQILNAGGKSTK